MVFSALLAAGADPKLRDHTQRTALDWAFIMDESKAVAVLKDAIK